MRGRGAGAGCRPLVFVQMIVFRDYGQVRGAGAGCVILLFLCK